MTPSDMILSRKMSPRIWKDYRNSGHTPIIWWTFSQPRHFQTIILLQLGCILKFTVSLGIIYMILQKGRCSSTVMSCFIIMKTSNHYGWEGFLIYRFSTDVMLHCGTNRFLFIKLWNVVVIFAATLLLCTRIVIIRWGFQIINEKAAEDRHSGVMMWPGGRFPYQGVNATYLQQWEKGFDFYKRVDTVSNARYSRKHFCV